MLWAETRLLENCSDSQNANKSLSYAAQTSFHLVFLVSTKFMVQGSEAGFRAQSYMAANTQASQELKELTGGELSFPMIPPTWVSLIWLEKRMTSFTHSGKANDEQVGWRFAGGKACTERWGAAPQALPCVLVSGWHNCKPALSSICLSSWRMKSRAKRSVLPLTLPCEQCLSGSSPWPTASEQKMPLFTRISPIGKGLSTGRWTFHHIIITLLLLLFIIPLETKPSF